MKRKKGVDAMIKSSKIRGLAVSACVAVSVWGFTASGQLNRPSLLNRRAHLNVNNRSGLASEAIPPPLVKLLPFAEAVQKAKDGDGAGLYAVALHYAKGDEVSWDDLKARLYLQMADDAGYGNAVLINTIVHEQMMSIGVGDEPAVLLPLSPDIGIYTGGISIDRFATRNDRVRLSERELKLKLKRKMLSLANAADVAAIRCGYERALKLGVCVASNELSRFEARLSAVELQRKIKDIVDAQTKKRKQLAIDLKTQNEKLAKELDGTITNSVLMALIKNGNEAKGKGEVSEGPRLGGLARLRQQRMEMEAKEREAAERKHEADAVFKAEQAEREAREQEERQRAAEERAQQREALRQIQEQLRRQREEREAEEKKR